MHVTFVLIGGSSARIGAAPPGLAESSPLRAALALCAAIFGRVISGSNFRKRFVRSEKIAGFLGLTAIAWTVVATSSNGSFAVGHGAFVAVRLGSLLVSTSILILARNWALYGAILGLLPGSSTAAIARYLGVYSRGRRSAYGSADRSTGRVQHRFCTQVFANA